jgi:acyl-CoA thioester hydrolase
MNALPTRNDYDVWKPLEVRWSDMDSMGHVNNANYFTYLEMARIDFLRHEAMPSGMKVDGKGFGLVSIKCDFRKQIHYPAQLEIGTRVAYIGSRSFHIDQGIFLAGSETLMAHGHSVMCWVDYENERALELSAELKAMLEKFMPHIR